MRSARPEPRLPRPARDAYRKALAAIDVLRRALAGAGDEDAEADGPVRRGRTLLREWHVGGGVVGLGVGHKVVSGRATPDIALRIYVQRKRARRALPAGARIPAELMDLGLHDHVATDVVEMGPPALDSLTDRSRPVYPGLSVGHCRSGETGTIGAILADPQGRPVLVSAAHVLAASGLARKGDRIVQPGGIHGGRCARDAVATLEAWTVLRTGPGFDNAADLAMATLDGAGLALAGQHPIGRLARASDVGLENRLVRRVGCMTAETPTTLSDLSYTAAIPYPLQAGRWEWIGFRDLLLYRAEGRGGDSGGPLVTPDGTLVGFHLGRVSAGWSVATPAWAIPAEWGLRVLNGGGM
jgi:hypothetical protein